MVVGSITEDRGQPSVRRVHIAHTKLDDRRVVVGGARRPSEESHGAMVCECERARELVRSSKSSAYQVEVRLVTHC